MIRTGGHDVRGGARRCRLVVCVAVPQTQRQEKPHRRGFAGGKCPASSFASLSCALATFFFVPKPSTVMRFVRSRRRRRRRRRPRPRRCLRQMSSCLDCFRRDRIVSRGVELTRVGYPGAEVFVRCRTRPCFSSCSPAVYVPTIAEEDDSIEDRVAPKIDRCCHGLCYGSSGSTIRRKLAVPAGRWLGLQQLCLRRRFSWPYPRSPPVSLFCVYLALRIHASGDAPPPPHRFCLVC